MSQNKQDLKKGLGDTIEEVFKKTGISYVAKKALGEDCGCKERKEKLNISVFLFITLKNSNTLLNQKL